MKIRAVFVAVLAFLALPAAAQHDKYHLEDQNVPQTSTPYSLLPEDSNDMRSWAFRAVTIAVAKDFGVRVECLMTQHEHIGWGRWSDGSYIIIFQNDREFRSLQGPGSVGLWGSDGPGISFQNVRGDGRRVHVLSERRSGAGFGLSLGGKKRFGFTFDRFPTHRTCPAGMRCDAECP